MAVPVTGWGPAETRWYKLPGQRSESSEGSMSNEAWYRDGSTQAELRKVRVRHHTEMEVSRLSSGEIRVRHLA